MPRLAQAAAVDTTALGTKQLLEMELADLHEPLVEDVPQYRFRRFEIKVCPHRIASGSYKDVMRSRMDGADKSPWASDTKRIRDDGRFGDEWRARNMPDFEDDPRLPATLTRYAKAPPRPVARSL